jgi:hypothetical protein
MRIAVRQYHIHPRHVEEVTWFVLRRCSFHPSSFILSSREALCFNTLFVSCSLA